MAGPALDPISAGAAALQSLVGVFNVVRGSKLAKRNVRPTLSQSGQYEDLLNLYEQQAQYGLDAGARSFATQENQSALSATLQSMLLAGASPNDVTGAYAGYSNQMQKLAAEDSDRRWQKINALSTVVDKLAESRQQEFLYNEDAPYKDRAQAAAAQMNAGWQQIWGGVDLGVSSALQNKAAKNAYNLQEDYFTKMKSLFPTGSQEAAKSTPFAESIGTGLMGVGPATKGVWGAGGPAAKSLSTNVGKYFALGLQKLLAPAQPPSPYEYDNRLLMRE